MRLTKRGRRLVAGVGIVAACLVTAGVLRATGGPHIDIPEDPCASPPRMLTVRGVTLQPLAMQAFRRAQTRARGRIEVVQSYRSCAQQAAACDRVCGDPSGCADRCAKPGSSYHQLGAAIDISQASLDTPGVIGALEATGWCQPLPSSDPGHFSYDGCH